MQGPELMTCGPYRPITLTTYDLRIRNMIALGSTTESISLNVKLCFDGCISQGSRCDVILTLKDAVGRVMHLERNAIQEVATLDISWHDLASRGAKLWWPVGYGTQNLYTVEAEITLEVHGQYLNMPKS